jgi:L-fuculose-phosphate aldolase
MAPLAIVFSHSRHEFVPIDNEGSYLLKKAPVVAEEFTSGSPEMANKVAGVLQDCKIVLLHGHGSFATGQTLDEPFVEYRKMSGSYEKW